MHSIYVEKNVWKSIQAHLLRLSVAQLRSNARFNRGLTQTTCHIDIPTSAHIFQRFLFFWYILVSIVICLHKVYSNKYYKCSWKFASIIFKLCGTHLPKTWWIISKKNRIKHAKRTIWKSSVAFSKCKINWQENVVQFKMVNHKFAERITMANYRRYGHFAIDYW